MNNGVEFKNSTFNGWNVFSIIGSIDVTTSASVEESLAITLNSAEKIALDMSATNYISSAGLRILLRLSKKAKRAKKHFAIFGVVDMVQDVFAASGMDMLITIYNSKENLP